MIKRLIGGLALAVTMGLGVGATIEALPPTQEEKVEAKADDHGFAYLPYKITVIDGENYYGESDDKDFPGLYFTEDYLKSENIKVGETVVAVFEADNTEDGLLAVVREGK